MSQNQKRKKQPDYRKNKRAFDSILALYRDSLSIGLGCVRLGVASGPSHRDPAKPLHTEFRCDVEKLVESVVKSEKLQWFWGAYRFDSQFDLEREMFVQHMLGSRRHSWEQRCGAAFIANGLYPARKYFDSLRGKKP